MSLAVLNTNKVNSHVISLYCSISRLIEYVAKVSTDMMMRMFDMCNGVHVQTIR